MENSDIELWKETLHNLVVTHATEQNKKLKEPVLIEGRHQVTGTEAINAYLEDLKIEVKSWWYCAC